MGQLALWLFMAWIGLVVAVGTAFLVWAWRQMGPFIVLRIRWGHSDDSKSDAELEKKGLHRSTESAVTRI